MIMTYVEFVIEEIKKYEISVPIYSNVIAERLAVMFDLPAKEASMATAVAMKRILDAKALPELRFYQKGIYYRTEKTLFGEVGINKELLIKDKYLASDMGYETGLSLLHRMGLTTQIPKHIILATNAAKDCAKLDKKLNVVIKPPKVKVNAENKKYLQMLDLLDGLSKAPVDVEKPFVIIARYIDDNKLAYNKLLAFANDHYNKNTILALAQTASAGGSAV